ncbi:MAG TPA: GtrA family protein [Jiangellaceae bacterium]|nr:GtrA family protein [Jiangellaceae bacterium]
MADLDILEHRTAAPISGAIRVWWYRLHHLVREGLKFAAVGGIGFVFDLMVFNFLLFSDGGHGPLHDNPLLAKTIAVVVATGITYSGNRLWTFRHRARTGLAREYSLFFLLNALGLGIALACLWFSRYALDLSGPVADNIANLAGIGLGTLFRFWSYRTWVFPAHRPAPAPTTSDVAPEAVGA